MSLFLSETLALYRAALVASFKKFLRSLIIVPAATAAYFFSHLALKFLQPFGPIIVIIIYGAIFFTLLGLFYSWLVTIHQTGRLQWDDLLSLDMELRHSLGSVGGILFIVYLVSTIISQTGGASVLLMFLQLAMLLVFNPLAEIIIINRPHGLAAFSQAQEFARSNAPEWFFIVILMYLPTILLFGTQTMAFISFMDVLIPARSLVTTNSIVLDWHLGLPGPIGLLIGIVVALWLTLVRLELFVLLDGSTRRQRAYRAKMR